MADEASVKELLGLTMGIAAQLEYLRELGVAHMGAAGEIDTNLAQPLTISTAAAQMTHEVAANRSSALMRNAEAEAAKRETQAAGAGARTKVGLPALPNPVAPPPTNSATVTNAPITSEGIEMAKRKPPVTTSAATTPAPIDTLFGEITPVDELSLPQPGETLADIWCDIGPQCMRCPLCCEGRKQVVNSEGNQSARLMFVGEAPGADEDAQARPFVGRAGQLLNKIIEAIGLKREEVFIGNVNRCRPSQNRTPTMAEAAVCKPFLLREIAIVRPAVIVVMGNTAMKNLLDTKEGITKLRGTFQDYKGIKVMPTFHPAYLLRDPSKKRETWEDMKTVREYLNTLKDKATD